MVGVFIFAALFCAICVTLKPKTAVSFVPVLSDAQLEIDGYHAAKSNGLGVG